MHDQPRRQVGQLTTPELDHYASQLLRCLKALGTAAPIRADVQRELADVRAEQQTRAAPGEPPPPHRAPDLSGLTPGELERTRRELAAALALARPGSPSRTPIQAHLSAIDAELAARAGQQT
jgi:hypothetical protein